MKIHMECPSLSLQGGNHQFRKIGHILSHADAGAFVREMRDDRGLFNVYTRRFLMVYCYLRVIASNAYL